MKFLYGRPDLQRLEVERDLGGLIAALRYKEDWQVQEAAAKAIGRLCNPEAQEPLHAALRETAVVPLCDALRGSRDQRFGEEYVRKAAAEALGQLRDPRSFEHFCAALKDPFDDVRASAAKALWHLGDPHAFEPFCDALRDSYYEVKTIAAYALGMTRDSRAVEPLCGALKDGACKVREAAAYALGEIGDPRAFEPLCTALQEGAAAAASALVVTGGSRAFEPLCLALGLPGSLFKNEYHDMRVAAAVALGQLRDPRAFEPLCVVLKNDYDPDLRKATVNALSQLGGPRAFEPVCTALKDDYFRVREAAVEALARLSDPRAVEPLCEVLTDDLSNCPEYKLAERTRTLPDTMTIAFKVRKIAAETLGQIGDPRAVEPLCTALESKDYDLRRAAADALGKIGDPRAVEPLCAALKNDYHYIPGEIDDPQLKAANARKTAAEALGKFRDLRALEPLTAAFEDEAFNVREAAAQAREELLKQRVGAHGKIDSPASLNERPAKGAFLIVSEKSAAEMQRVLVAKSSRNVFGVSFPELAAQEAAVELEKRDVGKHGTVYPGVNPNERPAKGAFVIVPEEGTAEMFYALAANGLVKFSQKIAMDFSYKPITLSKDPLHIEATPVESEMIVRHPRHEGDSYALAGRIIVVDPQFVDAKGNPTATELPKSYSEQVLKALNPFEFFRSFSATLDDMLKRAGANAQYFKQVLVETAKKWKAKAAPKDAETLERFATLAILHEATHFLICHLPDDLSSLPKKEQERQEAFSVNRYLAIINADTSLQVEFAKNLMKALRSLREAEPNKQSEDGISMIVLIEIFCDRFSVFLFENYMKIQIYQAVFGDLYGDTFSVSTMLNFEDERKRDPAAFMAKHPEVTKQIMEVLDKAEATHVYIDKNKYGDPSLTPQEKGFFRGFLDLLKHFDKQGTILQFTPEHMTTSRVVGATFSGLISRAGIGIMDVKIALYLQGENEFYFPGHCRHTASGRFLFP